MSNKREFDIDWRLSRRDLLRYGAIGAAGFVLSDGLVMRAFGLPQLPKPGGKGKAKSVIQIWGWGGPSHLDTFDPKPDAGSDYAGPLNHPIATNVNGMIISELMPELAKRADKFSIIRSMTHGNNGHETAAYMVQTGFKPGDGLTHPGVGAVVSLFKGQNAGYKGLIPPYVVLTQLLGRFSESGFLGFKAAPFATGGDPNATRFAVEGVVAEGITDQRQKARRDLLLRLDTMREAMKGSPQVASLQEAEDSAYDLILGDAGKVFDLSTEKDDIRTKYGKTTFGQSCLMARRLVEKGVPYVTINFGGWDTHKQNFPAMRRLVPQLDKGMATLIQDLSDRGLLDSTIVWWGGEFGRTPKIMWEQPWDGGRGHWGPVFSSVIAGGGFKGGHVVGSSDDKGEQVKDRPVYPNDLLASMYTLLDIDPSASIPHPEGLIVPATPPFWDAGIQRTLLTEIM
jgi:hypothetical protein